MKICNFSTERPPLQIFYMKFSGSLLTNFTQITIRSLTLLPVTSLKVTLREKCPNKEFFLVCICPYLYWLREDTLFLPVFSPNAGKYRPEKNSVFGHFSRKINYFLWFFSHWLERIDFYTAYYYTKNPLKFMLLFMSHILWFNMWFFNTVAVKTPLLYARLILQVAY